MRPLDDSTPELRHALLAGHATSRELVEACIARVREVNPPLNAMVSDRFERARAEADAADLAPRSGDALPPLHGIPCTIKEFLAVEDQPHTGGLIARRDRLAERDAPAVAALRRAGAIVLGVTNGPEGGLWSETYNKVYGRTRNPWDLRRTPGGSSGGEAALIATGAVPFGLGSDIGGSIRIPAAFCGVVGHKPTGGLVSTEGHTPANDSDFLVVGPLGRRVRDVRAVFEVLAGPGPYVDIETLRVRVVSEGLQACDPSVGEGLRRAADALRDAGADVQLVSLPDMAWSFWIWLSAMSTQGFPTYAEILGDGQPVHVAAELMRTLVGASNHTLPPLLVSMSETLAKVLPLVDHRNLERHRKSLQTALDALLDPKTVLLVPTMPRTAPRHHGMLTRFADAGWCGVFNVLGNPGTTVPTGFDRAGLPTAAQLVGARGQDHLTLAAAEAVEQRLGGWRRAMDSTA